jgi:dihydrofolate synthase/folylpolyglutamate synthase
MGTPPATEYQTLLAQLLETTADLPADRANQRHRMQAYLDTVGNPERTLPPAIHVTGTSGKTTTTTLAAAMLSSAGLRTAVFTSPHLQVINESFVIEGNPTSTPVLLYTLRRIQPGIDRFNQSSEYGPLRHFEIEVALAIALYVGADLDAIVIEVGLGGLRDATNVIDARTAVITSIGLDHTKFLGPTIEHIAREKAGIIKPGSTVVSGAIQPSVRRIIQTRADAQGARLLQLGRDYTVSSNSANVDAEITLAAGPKLRIPTGLGGPIRAHNTACAAVAAHAFTNRVDIRHINHAARTTHVPGRLEIVQDDPTVILDCADNAAEISAGLQALARRYPGRRPVVLFGVRDGKDPATIADILSDKAERVILTSFDTAAVTGTDPTRLKAVFDQVGPSSTTAIAEPSHAIDHAMATTPSNGLILVTGFYLVGILRSRWHPIPLAYSNYR